MECNSSNNQAKGPGKGKDRRDSMDPTMQGVGPLSRDESVLSQIMAAVSLGAL